MSISSSSPVQAALQGVQNADSKRAGLQMLLLKKALDAQKTEASQVEQLMTQKGSVVDLRV